MLFEALLLVGIIADFSDLKDLYLQINGQKLMSLAFFQANNSV